MAKNKFTKKFTNTRLKKYFRRVYDLNYISQNEDQFIDDVAKE